MNKKVSIYTDGSYFKIQDRGGYGIVISYDDQRIELSRGFEGTTSNRMELMGVIVALEKIEEFVNGYNITIYSDSKYVINSVEKGWLESWAHANWKRTNGKKLKNADLWQRFYPLMMKHNFNFQWVKAHNGHEEHDRADQLAYKSANGKRFKRDLSTNCQP